VNYVHEAKGVHFEGLEEVVFLDFNVGIARNGFSTSRHRRGNE
jgi:hypothetical protein